MFAPRQLGLFGPQLRAARMLDRARSQAKIILNWNYLEGLRSPILYVLVVAPTAEQTSSGQGSEQAHAGHRTLGPYGRAIKRVAVDGCRESHAT
eukprot:scaffold665730_cov42-Prasinocladus_malaysianus.AAC.1